MKTSLYLLLCAVLISGNSIAQTTTEVALWLTNTEINGSKLQILRAPADALNGNAKFDILDMQKQLDKNWQFYRQHKKAETSSFESNFVFVQVQNPQWPLQYYRQEMEAFMAYNKTLSQEAIASNNRTVQRFRDSTRIAALVNGQAFVQQPYVLLKDEPSPTSMTMGKVYQYSYVAYNGRVENSDYIEVTVGDKHTGFIKQDDVVASMDELQAPAEKLERMKQVRLYDFEPTDAYKARLNKEAAEEAAQSKAMNAAPKRKLIRGPQGGCYFVNESGNRQYVERGLCK